MPNTPRYLEQGPEAKPRNYLADMLREYGMRGLSDRLNSPTSGIGMLVDAVGGLGNALVVQPAQSFNRLLQYGYESGNPQSAEDAFNVAGAAMVGGLAAPRPRAAGAPKEQPLVAYRGSAYGGKSESPTYWASSNPETAADYARAQALDASRNRNVSGQSITPAEFRFNNPLKVDAAGGSWWDIPHKGEPMSTDNIARLARRDGHDGLIVSNVTDGVFGGGTPQTTIAALQPGTVYSTLTGELLYANGGRQGAATGAAANASAERQGIRAYRGMADNRSLPIQNRKGQVWASSNPEVASQYSYVDDALNLSGEFTQRHVDSLNPRITPLDFRFQNPLVVDHAKDWIFRHTDGKVYDTDSFADMAKSAGHDGIIVKGITDSTKERGDTIAALQPGRTYSALTGELLYSNGGRPGAAVGAAANAAAERQGIRSIDQLGRSDPHPGPVIGYHGTTASFDTFDPAKMQDPLGPFFGTSAMADKFAQPNYARPSQGNTRVIPAQISSNKALDIAEDPSVIGTGRDTYIQPRDLVSSLEGAGLKPLDDPAVKQAFERTSVGNDFKSFRDRMGAERFGMEETSHHTADRIRFDALKDFMARNGYDTIRRWNEAGNGWEYAPVVRGIVQSPETGATLYSGGRPGAAVGAATSAPQDNRELKSILDKYGLGNLLPQADFARKMQPGDA